VASKLSDLEHYDKVRDGWLLDTNIISAIIGDKPVHPGVAHFFETIRDERLRLSVITIGEIHKGIELLPFDFSIVPGSTSPNNEKRYALSRKLEELELYWSDRIVGIDNRVAKCWGDLLAHYQNRGNSLPAVDALIAATAYVHNLVLVSNDAVFARLRERVIVYNPFAQNNP
jgi:hypothetical protein